MSPVHLYPINVNNLHCCAIRAKGCLYGGGSVLLVGRANHCCRDRASQLNSLLKFVFVYMRGGPAVLGGISLLTNEISPNRGGNFPFSSQERWKYSIFLLGALEIFHFPPRSAGNIPLLFSLFSNTFPKARTNYRIDNIRIPRG